MHVRKYRRGHRLCNAGQYDGHRSLQFPGASVPTALELLIGERRARILESLTTPKTTGETAAAAGIALSTASEHLHDLTVAGVVALSRSGRSVTYVLTDTGRRLVDEFGRSV